MPEQALVVLAVENDVFVDLVREQVDDVSRTTSASRSRSSAVRNCAGRILREIET